MKSVWYGKSKLILFLVIFIGMILLPGCDDFPTRPGEGFYSYQGYRDWWRIPLRFPYQITLILLIMALWKNMILVGRASANLSYPAYPAYDTHRIA